MRKTKKTLAILAIVAMVLAMLPVQVFAATASAADSDRYAGADRIQTALAVAANWTSAGAVVLAPADDANLVDALAAAPLAGQENAPILLTYKSGLNADVKAKIAALGATKVYVIGAAANDAVVNALTGVTVEKLAGADRWATAAAINAKLTNVAGTFVVGYDAIPDALSAASYAAANRYQIALTNVDGSVNAASLAGSKTYLVGGTGVVKDYAGATRFGGADRYATNEEVVKGLTYQFSKVYIANGETLVDALVAAPLAAQAKAAVLLANTSVAGADYVNGKLASDSKVIALGGTGVVPDAVKAGVKYQAPAVLAVESVSAINAYQLKVVFNSPVNSTSATTIGNYYSVNTAGIATPLSTPSVATLQDDKKTVIITLATPLTNGGAYAYKVSGVTGANLTVAPDYTSTFIASDTTAPTLVSATATAKIATNTITLTFSEPVDTTSASVTVNGTFATVAPVAAPNNNQVTVTSGSSLMAGTTYNLNIMNFKDGAGNFIPTNPLAATVTVQADTVAPNVTNVVVNGDSQLEVTFDKAMDINTLTANTNVKILDTNLTPTAGTLGAPTAKDTTNKVFDFAISGTTGWNSSNVMNAIVALNSSVADTSGNTITAVTRNVSFTKDTTAPGLVSAVYKNTATYGTNASGAPISTPNGSIVFKYNTAVVAGTAPTTVINDQGLTVAGALGTPVVNSSDTTELVVPLATPVASGTVSYMILLPNGMVTDSAQTPNASIAVNQVVSVSAGAVVAGDTTASAVYGTPSGTTASLTSGSVISVAFTEAGSGLDLTTVVNTNNYRLDGLPLPAGSYVTVTATGTAPGANTITITIPSGSITADKNATGTPPTGGYVFTISGIKDKSGNVMSTYVGNVTLHADANPVLNSAVINAGGTASIGFSLAVKSATTVTTGADLVVTANGSPLAFVTTPTTGGAAGAPTQYTLTDGTGADAGKYVITAYDAAGNVYNLTNATSFSVATSANPSNLTGHIMANTALTAGLKASTTITVK